MSSAMTTTMSGAMTTTMTNDMSSAVVVPLVGRARRRIGERRSSGCGQRLPGHADIDPFERLALAFLLGYPRHSAQVLPRRPQSLGRLVRRRRRSLQWWADEIREPARA